ncbi:sigma-70 family RNA polymerase sigma factor [Clostridium magnum]|uniref:ECF RNA polymerase sigma factor SigW n=1 Tax=Clostridium magnum DSM 2767 TaxID=1121326 RepID=A0A161YJI4_9CLOT|nr:sigma-70 family RNA polymerase sigma factor [Clostridium magnum]KZL90612.1 ECF RNA polymerase sigma factor SigW [Clostridium magnum DSM 2767]SHI05862.1 RNA polymerase sigma-70 factor, ECF subfamily [Clostridium magnum DSM 2767]
MEEEIKRLMDSYGNDVLRVAYLYLKDKHLAEDAFQEVFIKVYKNFDKFKKNSSEKTWIISITMNTCRDILRISWFKKVLMFKDINNDSLLHSYENIDNKVINRIQNENLLKEVMNLPSKYKEPLILYYYEELSTVDISKMLKIPEGTVRNRLFRARTILKSNIGGKIEYER